MAPRNALLFGSMLLASPGLTRAGCNLEVTVRDYATDAPLQDIQVLLGEQNKSTPPIKLVLRTDANGKARFSGLPVKPASDPGFFVSAEDNGYFREQVGLFQIADGETKQVSFRLRKRVALTVLAGADGAGAHGAVVDESGHGVGQAVADAQGKMSFQNLVPGPALSLTVTKAGFATLVSEVAISGADAELTRYVTLLKGNPGSGKTFTGSYGYAEGYPIANAAIGILCGRDAGNAWLFAMTDSAGRFAIDHIPPSCVSGTVTVGLDSVRHIDLPTESTQADIRAPSPITGVRPALRGRLPSGPPDWRGRDAKGRVLPLVPWR